MDKGSDDRRYCSEDEMKFDNTNASTDQTTEPLELWCSYLFLIMYNSNYRERQNDCSMTLNVIDAIFVEMKLLFYDQCMLALIDFPACKTSSSINVECGPIRNPFE